MKKTNVFLLLAFATVTFFTSCSTVNKAMQSAPILSRSVELDPIKADLSVDQSKKLKGESSSSYLLFFRLTGDSKYADNISYSAEAKTTERLLSFLNPFKIFKTIATGDAVGKVKAAAAYNALENSNADVLVHPMYTITEKSYLIFYVYKAEVSGYGGVYKNFRNEKQKIMILDNGKEIMVQDK
jgi:hypothetical protein